VHRRLSFKLLCSVLVVLFAGPALAAPRDKAANKKIDEAINQHYLATNFDKAEGILTGTVKACEDKCSPSVLARAWMYVGIVRGSGRNDLKGAQEAFAQAISLDAGVKLDAALATPETAKAFDSAGGKAGPPVVAEAEPKAAPDGQGQENIAGNMECTPEVHEIGVRYPVPIFCSSDEEAAKAEVFYKEFGGEGWKPLKMQKKAGGFRAQIPCSATQTAGTLRVYVRAKDKSGDNVDSWGSKRKPVEFNIVSETEAEPPAFPNEDPPARCAEKETCPPDFPGCNAGGGGTKAWGASCASNDECEGGLACVSGACETAQTCESNADCNVGKCEDGVCSTGRLSAPGKARKNWFGIHVAQDWAFAGGEDVCSVRNQKEAGYACFDTENTLRYKNGRYNGNPQPGVGDNINGGFLLATTRVLLSYDRLLIPNVTAGARAGYAFGGGPPAGANKFLPVHLELRGTFWFGKNPLAQKGLRPYVHLGGGLAQVDAKVSVPLVDCSTLTGGADATQVDDDACQDVIGTRAPNHPELKVDAWRKLGQGFATAGGGVVYTFTDMIGAQLNLNAMFLLPTSGPVLEPSLGVVVGL